MRRTSSLLIRRPPAATYGFRTSAFLRTIDVNAPAVAGPAPSPESRKMFETISETLNSGFYELTLYFRTFSKTQWGVVAVASVVFGFVCLKSDSWKD